MPEVNFDNDYDLGEAFEPCVLAAVLRTQDFFEKYQSVLTENAFRDAKLASLMGMIRGFYERYRQVPTLESVRDLVRNSQHRDPGGLLAALEELPTSFDSAYVGDRVLTWARLSAIDDVLADPELRRDPQALAHEVAEASSIGESVNFRFHDILSDEGDETARGEVIPLPWDHINTHINGGPEVGDFGILMTPINGGKTCALCNIARHGVALGKNVLYLTAEDGPSKIKRRMLQTIAGWTIEQVIADLHRARELRDRFFRATGGAMYIERLRSRRTTVDDVMGMVRQLNKIRKVDIVITDYADRFRPVGRYSEPRHGLREIYEDCKFLPQELQVVHWSASQANRQATGKDVINMDMGTESTGKFESCDWVISLGQSLEDQKLGRMTGFLAKGRDAEKYKTFPLIADFACQRIYQPGDQMMMRRAR